MAQEPVTGGTGLPEERSKLPIVQTEQQAGITDTLLLFLLAQK